ncbi:group 1 truncated hemoglobin [Halogeometricum sp. S1BR25-6]|uniref:Group 1 truncated hemoglobin n=1 Tax=Halogeometricum salsisoli TaxID=2950536 RepID=A0ABU2GDU8_9EURY|nr:group 1 truncated hemoglobin [Halogeometricum sp. S1BR25-6]MDS0298453.1 group 1 truncated hemoglobin [Halogeometricum sp. S1BR25-6]
MSEETLYHRLGGRDAIASVVDVFYDRVLADDRLEPYFEDVDMTKQRAHQTQFIAAMAGGPGEYDGGEMEEVHEGMGIDHEAYDAIEEHLDAALAEHDVPAAERADVEAAIESFRDDIVDEKYGTRASGAV